MCCSGPVNQAIPTTLHLSDSVFGSGVVLTYYSAGGYWWGSQLGTVPAIAASGCGFITTTAMTVAIYYTLGCSGGGYRLEVSVDGCSSGVANGYPFHSTAAYTTPQGFNPFVLHVAAGPSTGTTYSPINILGVIGSSDIPTVYPSGASIVVTP